MDKKTFYCKLDELLELPPGTVQGSAELAAIEAWDSLTLLDFIAMADSQYGVSLPGKAIAECRTADDLATLVEESQRG
jgi:acyl carrier protein